MGAIGRAFVSLVGASRTSRARRCSRRRPAVDDLLLASLRPVYQPILDLRTGEVVAREALSRFPGQEPKAVFHRAALEGTADRLEAAAVRAALASWDGEGLLALNASPNALMSQSLQAVLPSNLAGIVIEITEQAFVGYTAEVMLVIEGLRARGALIAIDDFGVGYSNMQRVVAFRPDIVKLDMSLIRGIEADPVRQAVVAGAVVFGEQANAQVVAEGIETAEERDCLVRLGVRFGQGYLLGAPGPLLAGC